MLTPVVRSDEADPARRGRGLGEGRRERIVACWSGYERLFAAVGAGAVREVGEAALERIGAWAPDLAAEIDGIAAGAGLEPWQVSALNARTEVLARARGECSTVVVVPPEGGPPRTLQTWDWHEHLRDTASVWELTPRPGRVVRTFTELGIVGKIGVNDAGLGLHFNILRHASDGGRVGVPVHVVARRILDEAESVAEAAAIARSAEVAASTVLTVVDRGTAACLELSPAGMAELPIGDDGVLIHTNHFLDPRLAAGERMREEDPGSWDRLETLRRRAGAEGADLVAAMLSHEEDGAAVCCHAPHGARLGERYATLATISLDVAGGHLSVRAGGPCATDSDWLTV